MPTGPFAVGRLSTTWVDATRVDPFSPTPGQKRELVVWIWYPARRSDESQTADYVPDAWRRATAEYSGVLFTHFLWHNDAVVRGHSLENTDLAQDRPTFPVVIFRSGIGALALNYTTLVEDLASHGFVVVGADVPYSTCVVDMPDGRVIHKTDEGNPGDAPITEAERDRLLLDLLEVWTADTRFMLDQVGRINAQDPAGRFTGRLDLNAVGVAGHSFGGAAAVQFCHDDSRCSAGIDLDGAPHGSVVNEGITQPFLFLLSDHGNASSPPDQRIGDNIRSVATMRPDHKLIVTMIGANHFSFSDDLLVQSRILRSILVALGGSGGLDARTGLALTTLYVREFFDVHLRGAPPEALYSGPLAAGVRFETR